MRRGKALPTSRVGLLSLILAGSISISATAADLAREIDHIMQAHFNSGQSYRIVQSRGVGASEPIVSNGLWATELVDPDGYQLLFESPTDVPEGTRLSEVA